MSRYDGLIIPRSYSEYINKTDAATLQQALQLSGVLSGTVAAGDNKAVKSSAVANELGTNYYNKQSVDAKFLEVGEIDILTDTYNMDGSEHNVSLKFSMQNYRYLGIESTWSNSKSNINFIPVYFMDKEVRLHIYFNDTLQSYIELARTSYTKIIVNSGSIVGATFKIFGIK